MGKLPICFPAALKTVSIFYSVNIKRFHVFNKHLYNTVWKYTKVMVPNIYKAWSLKSRVLQFSWEDKHKYNWVLKAVRDRRVQCGPPPKI